MESWLTKTPPKHLGYAPYTFTIRSYHRVINLRNKIKKEETQTEEERDGEDESEKSKFVPCPICNSSVSKASINSHIDACLRSNDSKLTQKGAFSIS
jgi:hypothetical protein